MPLFSAVKCARVAGFVILGLLRSLCLIYNTDPPPAQHPSDRAPPGELDRVGPQVSFWPKTAFHIVISLSHCTHHGEEPHSLQRDRAPYSPLIGFPPGLRTCPGSASGGSRLEQRCERRPAALHLSTREPGPLFGKSNNKTPHPLAKLYVVDRVYDQRQDQQSCHCKIRS